MAISHELSSEIATALFAAKQRSPRELNDLRDIVFAIHNTLEQLTGDPRKSPAFRAAMLDRHTRQAAAEKAGADS